MDKSAFYKLSYGLYVVSSLKGEHINGQIANTVFQVTSEPPTLAVSINKQNYTHSFIESSGVFSVSILGVKTPMDFIGRFGFKSGRETDKFAGVTMKRGISQVPVVLDNAVAYLEALVVHQFDCGTHTIFLGEVKDGAVLTAEEPMTYAYYHLVKGGRAPKTAPTYISTEEATRKEDREMARYVCEVCGYVYDPEKGDPERGIAAGTSFDDLPEDWVCPVCGADKSNFSPE